MEFEAKSADPGDNGHGPTLTAEAPEVAERVHQTADPAQADPAPADVRPVDPPELEPIAQDDLLGELARAMHAAATLRRERMNAELESLRAEQLAAIAARAGSEVELLKVSSETDIGAIDAWATAEAERIRLERIRRIDSRREQLANQLGRQESIKAREVIAVGVAIDGHRNEIDVFFGRIDRETDPSAIARLAATPPAPPSLAEIAAEARRGAAAEFANLDRQAATGHGTADTNGASRPVALIAPNTPRAVDGNADRPWETEPYAVTVAAGPPAVAAPVVVTAPAVPAGPPVAAAPAVVAPPAVVHEPDPPMGLGSTLLRTVRSIRPMAARQDPEAGEGDGQR